MGRRKRSARWVESGEGEWGEWACGGEVDVDLRLVVV